VTHTVAHREPLRVIGYLHVQNAFSVPTEAFVENCLAAREDGVRPVDDLLRSAARADSGEYVGVTLNFVDGANYEYLFGITCDRFPDKLPEDAMRVKIGGGDWAVYNSSANEYPSIWKAFTDHFYEQEQMGYDLSRVPFEIYGAEGQFRDVHIPVDADCAKDSAKFIRLVHTPDITAAGFKIYSEHDYPLYQELDFDPRERLLELFPLAERVICGSKHADLGKPISETYAVETDRLSVVPEDIDSFMIRGGYWHLEGRQHFNGGSCGWPIGDVPGKPTVEIVDLAHPRHFVEYRYRSRGGHSEIAVPVRVQGELGQGAALVELVTREPCRILGRQEAPPQGCLTDDWIERVQDVGENPVPGSRAYAFTYARRGKGEWFYFDRPVTVGFLAEEDTPIPEGYEEYRFPGGKYLRFAEALPNGEYHWGVLWYLNMMEKQTGHKPDLKRSFIVDQREHGRAFVCYIPVT
jgi:predicted transcriptional regulator YdeE